ncbi:MAG TPA: cobalamin biosynthesis protein CbiG [Thermoanaerobaculia bacterium]|jgi:precorrin-8X/cobalt-precorrin-8 methylmutase|nr:cobalamin biosynthesis protein CbiG [Thermoanaerobaculia bacterium]
MPIFDAYLMVDWSANSKPKTKKDSIWAAWLQHGRKLEVRNLPTRAEALEFAFECLRPAYREGIRTLVGFDFAYAYPKGLARALGWTSEEKLAPWRYVWNEISVAVGNAAQPRNTNDRFSAAASLNRRIGDPTAPGPFWARPVSKTLLPGLLPTRSTFPYPVADDEHLESRRFTDIPGAQEVWKLFTAGSVGSQSLLGIPVVRGLRDDQGLQNHSRVWPFETGFSPNPTRDSGALVIHAEIWPGILDKRLLENHGKSCRDEAQVILLAELLARLDEEEELGTWFDVPQGLDQHQQDICVKEEGWILGARRRVRAEA